MHKELSFGVNGASNVASINGYTYAGLGGFGSKVSFHLGGLAEVPVSEKFSAQPELLYSSQGTKLDLGSSADNLKLDYINLPILAKYYIIEGLSAEAGPLFGLLMTTNAADDNRFKKIDVAFAIGASYKPNENIFFWPAP